MALPPVARMSATPGWFIRAVVASIDGCLDPLDAVLGRAGGDRGVAHHAGGRDASTRCAAGWKANTIGLRVFSAISDLKIVVEVGLVTGVTPQTTPTGSAISVMPLRSSREMTPTVLQLRHRVA